MKKSYLLVLLILMPICLLLYKQCSGKASKHIPIAYDKAYVEALEGFEDAEFQKTLKKHKIVLKKVDDLRNKLAEVYNFSGTNGVGWDTDPGDFARIKLKLNNKQIVQFDNREGWIKVLEKSGSLSGAVSDYLNFPAHSTKVNMQAYCVTLDMGCNDYVLILFGYPYESTPGLLTLIYVNQNAAEIIFNKHVKLLKILETEKGYRLKGERSLSESTEKGGRTITYPGQRCELFLETNSLKFYLSPELDREKLVLPIKFNNSYVEDLKLHWDFESKDKGDIDLKRLGQITELGATIIEYFGEGWDAQLGDFTEVGFKFSSNLHIDFSNFDHGWSKPSPQIKLPQQSDKVIKHEYGIILDIGESNHILALTGYKYTQEPSFLTLICVTPDNADMVFNKKVELLEVQETEKGYRLLGQLPATQQEQAGRLCEVCIEGGELWFKEL